MSEARDSDLAEARIQRLGLDGPKVEAMASGLETVASLPDPVGAITQDRELPNGQGADGARAHTDDGQGGGQSREGAL